MEKVYIFLITLLFSSFSYAVDVFTIEEFEIEAWSSGTLVDTLGESANAINNLEGCSAGGRYLVVSEDNNINYDYMHALLLEARVSSTPLLVRISGCQNSRPRIVAIVR